MKNNFPKFVEKILDFMSKISKFIDNLLSNPRYTKFTALAFALIIVGFIALGEGVTSLVKVKYESGVVLSAIPVSVSVDSNLFEVSGTPKNVDAYVIGELAEIQDITNRRNLQVGLDLRNLNEGTHNVKLVVVGSTENTRISLSPSNVTVTLRKKIERKYTFSYDFINKSTSEDLLYSEPKFEFDAVTIKASEYILNQIKSVKAIVNVNNQSSGFTTDATIVAYNETGDKLDVTAEPFTIKTSVAITKPSKEVPIKIATLGSLQDTTKAIDKIEMSDSVTTLLGNSNLLKDISSVEVSIPLSQIHSDSKLELPVIVSNGITSTVKNVSVTVTLAEKQSKTLTNIPITVLNNPTNYKVQIIDEADHSSDIEVFGTERQLSQLSLESIKIYPKLTNIVEGDQVVELVVEKPTAVDIKLAKQSIRIRVTK